MKAVYTNWDTDWSHCFIIQPKRDRMKWCPNCQEFHDKACFFRFKGGWLGCMISIASRAKSMGKIKGGMNK